MGVEIEIGRLLLFVGFGGRWEMRMRRSGIELMFNTGRLRSSSVFIPQTGLSLCSQLNIADFLHSMTCRLHHHRRCQPAASLTWIIRVSLCSNLLTFLLTL